MAPLAFETTSVHIGFDSSNDVTPVINPGTVTGGILMPDGSGNATALISFDSSNDKIYHVSTATIRAMGSGASATLIFVRKDGTEASVPFSLTGSWVNYPIPASQQQVIAVKLVLSGSAARADTWDFSYRQMLDCSGQTSTTGCNESAIDCGDIVVASGRGLQPGPISLRHGEKRETITDLRISTPNEPLTFTRYYRQFYQNTLQFMGLGWSHNHNYQVHQQDLGGGLKRIRVQMPDGGEILLLDNNPEVGGFYQGERGVQAELTEYPDETDEYYYLNMLDGNKYYFDKDSRYITSHILPNGDTWVYHYSTAGFDTGLLSYVEDNYGNQIKFRYIDNAGQFNHKMLWRVGDQLTGNMGGTPTGRYLEFTYTVEPNNPSNAKALLTTVRDVRGQTWEYEYHAHIDYNGSRLNTLRYYRSPSVAAVSNDFVNGRLILKNLTYTYQGSNPNKYISQIVQKLGKEVTPYLREETYDFIPDEATARTEVTIAGKTTKHYFDYGVYYGVEDPTAVGNYQQLDENYRTHKLIDGNSNTNVLNWTESGHFLTQVQDAENKITAFVYSDNNAIDGVLEETTDAVGRKTKYKYHYTDNNRKRLPTIIRMVRPDGSNEILLSETHFRYNTAGRKTEEIVFDPQDGEQSWQASGNYAATPLTRTLTSYWASGSGGSGASYERLAMLKTVAQYVGWNASPLSSTTFYYDEYGRVVKTSKSSLFGTCEFTHTVYDAADLVIATICGHGSLTTIPTTEAGAIAVYETANPDKYRITVYTYDSLGRRIEERTDVGSTLEQKRLIFYDSLNRVVRTIANYVVQGSSQPGKWWWNGNNWQYTSTTTTQVSQGVYNDQNIIEELEYNELGQVRLKRDVTGQVTLYAYDDAGRVKKIIQNASDADYFGLKDDLNTPGSSALIGGDTYSEVSDSDQDIITKYVYDEAGNIIKKRLNPDTAYEQATVYTYDGRNRVVQSDINPVIPFIKEEDVVFPVEDDDGTIIDDLNDLHAVKMRPDREVAQSTRYDALGRVIRRRVLVDNRPYDSINLYNKVWRTTLYGYDDLDRVVKVITNAVKADYFDQLPPDQLPQADLSTYGNLSTSADQDLVTETAYDENGRVMWESDVNGIKTWSSYDGLGRIIKKIVNPKAGVSDPRQNYTASSNPEEDLITWTYYDTDGRVQRVQEPLGRWTLYGYSTGGRLVRTVQNASKSSFFTVPNAAADLSNYETVGGTLSTDTARDIITSTTYDAKGRVKTVTDTHGNVTYTVYDDLDRVVLTVQNYVVQGSTTPEQWLWDSGQSRWENGSNTAISFSAANDQNIITANEYDPLGRLVSTRDSAGRVTRYCYDRAGRRTRTVVNYVAQGSTQPEGWYWNGNNWQYSLLDSTAVDQTSGAAGNYDQNLITMLTYNKAGHVIETRDTRNTRTTLVVDRMGRAKQVNQAVGVSGLEIATYTCYDKLGQVLRTIQNYVATGTSPDVQNSSGVWTFNPASHGTYNDENLITLTEYDLAGRQIQLTNPAGNSTTTVYTKDGTVKSVTEPGSTVTQYRYDDLRRLKVVVQGYIAQGASDPSTWHWNGTNYQRTQGSTIAIVHGTHQDENIIVQLTYDRGGRVLKRRDPRGKETLYYYDDLDRRLQLNNPLSKIWWTVYNDLSGNRTSISMNYPGINGSSGYTVQRDFDRLGRPISISYNNAATTPDIDFAYDISGNRTLMTEFGTGRAPLRKTQFTYDQVRRATQAQFDNDGNGTYDQAVSYQYDRGSLRTQLTLPDGKLVTYSYNVRGHLTGLADNWSGSSLSTTLTYDDLGRLRKLDRPNNLDTDYVHDVAGRVTRIKHYNGATTLAQYDYLVNARGDRTQAQEQWLPAGGSTLTQQTLTYTYDKLARVQDAKYYTGLVMPGPSTPIVRQYGYDYDVAGNRLSEVETISGSATTTTFTYNNGNQLTGDGTHTYEYDHNGNLLTKKQGGTTIATYAWDHANRLKTFGSNSYNYDGDGNRIKQTISGTPTNYVLDLASALPTILTETTGANILRYLHGPRGLHFQQDASSNREWLLPDGLGSVRGMASNANAVLETRQYTPYGEPFGTSGTNQTSYGFTGEPTDSNGLIHLRARYYLPSLGVFTALDPWEGINQRPMSVNGYGWVEGNVINVVDPGGRQPEFPVTDCDHIQNNYLYLECRQQVTGTPCPRGWIYRNGNGAWAECQQSSSGEIWNAYDAWTIHLGGTGYGNFQQRARTAIVDIARAIDDYNNTNFAKSIRADPVGSLGYAVGNLALGYFGGTVILAAQAAGVFGSLLAAPVISAITGKPLEEILTPTFILSNAFWTGIAGGMNMLSGVTEELPTIYNLIRYGAIGLHVAPLQAAIDTLLVDGDLESLLFGSISGVGNAATALVSKGSYGILITALATASVLLLDPIFGGDDSSESPLSGCGVPSVVK